MKFTINGNGRDQKQVKGISFQRLNCYFNLDNIPDANTDLSKINLKMVLNRNGKQTTIVDDNLQRVILLASFKEPSFSVAHTPSGVYMTTSGVASLLVATIDFGQCINVSTNDVLSIEVTHSSGWQGGTATTAGSYATYELRRTIGNGVYVPQFRFYPVPTASTTFEQNLGDNIVALGNFSNSTIIPSVVANQITTSQKISSDKLDLDETVEALIVRNTDYFGDWATATIRKNNFVYYPEVPLDNATMKLSMRAGSVTASNLWIGVIQYDNDMDTIQRAKNRHERHLAINSSKFIK